MVSFITQLLSIFPMSYFVCDLLEEGVSYNPPKDGALEINWKRIAWWFLVIHCLFFEKKNGGFLRISRQKECLRAMQGSSGLQNKINLHDRLDSFSLHFRFRNCLGFSRILEEKEGKLQRVYILVFHFKALPCFPI